MAGPSTMVRAGVASTLLGGFLVVIGDDLGTRLSSGLPFLVVGAFCFFVAYRIVSGRRALERHVELVRAARPPRGEGAPPAR
jgi:hypothetical protein